MSVTAIPIDGLYFAVLDAPVARGRARAEELGYAFEACLPCPMESVHATYRPLARGRILAIGLPKTAAESLPRDTTAAHPRSWPEWLEGSHPTSPESVNLLTGDAEPAVVRHSRKSIARLGLITIAAIAAIASVGLERRIRKENREQAQTAAAIRGTYTNALGSPSVDSGQPPAAIMTSELRRLRATRQPAEGTRAAMTSADQILAGLLSAWPEGAEPQTDSITIAERSIELVIRVPDLETAQQFVTALGSAPGLTNASSSTAQDRDGIRLTLRLDREVAP